MALITHELSAGAHKRAAPVRWALRVADGMRSLLVRHRHRRAVAGLLSLDDHLLADIGVTRGDVAATLSLPLSRDPSGRLLVLAVERRAARRAHARERLERSRQEACCD